MTTQHFGSKLASLRGHNRMGQKEVAAYLKIKQEAYSRMERTPKRTADDKLDLLGSLYKMTPQQIEAYDPASFNINNFYDKVMQVNHIGSMVVSGIDNAIDKVLNAPELWNGEEVTLAITFKLVNKAG